MKYGFTYLFLWLIGSFSPEVCAQVRVAWRQWPAPLQLYARNSQNLAEVPIEGRLQSDKYAKVSLLVYQNGTLWKAQRTDATRNGTAADFAFKPSIVAGRNEYKFQVYAVSGTDSTLVATRDSILCGDVYLMAGQSNIAVWYPIDYNYNSKFLRTFGTPTKPDTLWRIANTNDGEVGLSGIQLQRRILEQYGMPTCLINQAVGGSSVWNQLVRRTDLPLDTVTIYGRQLYRARKAGVSQNVRAMVWWQGETEAGGGTAQDYDKAIRTLFANWATDYRIGKTYVCQINLLNEANNGAGWLRDFQRQLAELYPRTETIATTGLPTYNGIHYEEAGYNAFAGELARLVARDFYGATDTVDVSSPALRRAYYRTTEQREVVLDFDRAVSMRWQQDTTITDPASGYQYNLDLRDLIFFDYSNDPQERVIESGRAEANRIILTLKKSTSAKSITYLPNYYRNPRLNFYNGPLLRSGRGMRTLTFYRYPLAAALAAPTSLTARAQSDRQIDLAWQKSEGDVTAYRIERSTRATDSFAKLAEVSASTLTYSDQTLPDASTRYYYRVTAVSKQAESGYSNVAEAAPLILALSPEPDALVVYPVPVRTELQCRLPERWQHRPVAVSLTDGSGRVVLQTATQSTQTLALKVGTLRPGTYVLGLRLADERLVQSIVVE